MQDPGQSGLLSGGAGFGVVVGFGLGLVVGACRVLSQQIEPKKK